MRFRYDDGHDIGEYDKDSLHQQVGFVFQHYALFGHLSIFENVAFGLRVRPRRERLPNAEIARRDDASAVVPTTT